MTSSTTNADRPEPSAFIKRLPTMLTLFRIAMGPVIAALILWASLIVHRDPPNAGLIYALCFILFVIAALTDWLDGRIARAYNVVSPLGAALDHSADKVLIVCVLIALAYASLPIWLVAAAVIILGRDVAVAGLREGLSASGRSLPVSELGKWKAAAEMAGVGAFLAFQTSALRSAPEGVIMGLDWAARLLLWAAALLALISGAQYAAAAAKPRA